MNCLYQLIGYSYLKAGDIVDINGPHDRWGKIIKLEIEDFKLPNPCMIDGPTKFIQQKINLYLIRGGDFNPYKEKVPSVWGFTS